MQYHVVYRGSVEELIKEVSRLIGEGWMPQGGVSVGGAGYGAGLLAQATFVFAQALVRETK